MVLNQSTACEQSKSDKIWEIYFFIWFPVRKNGLSRSLIGVWMGGGVEGQVADSRRPPCTVLSLFSADAVYWTD